jgi:hypothetical protein
LISINLQETNINGIVKRSDVNMNGDGLSLWA